MFSIPLLPLIQSDSPVSSITVSGLASWMTFNVATSTIELAGGYTAVPPPPQDYTITINATNAVGTGTGTIGIHVFTVAPPLVSGPASISHLIGLTETANYTATNSPTSWSVSPTVSGLSIDGGATGATLTMDATFNTDDIYTIYAHNAGGTGSTVTNITLGVPLNPLYWTYMPQLVDVAYGTADIEIYDDPFAGNLVAYMAYTGLDTSYGPAAFNVIGALNDGQTYYAKGIINWSYIGGTYDPNNTTIATSGFGSDLLDVYTGPNYYTSGRLPFTYNLASPNVLNFTFTTM